ncbi:MAG TPA: bifunctional 5,10-methylenetetrahydrofolate dehydrogenase/5,10-methenyltetrahydrofolate cyclohydrolase, partial [Terriglobia bacterium]|nr:bifunctional 5,10-methylenetetrahydrofolate dehydrogenase/5,10-methenyltetrahydrofolate cyclohydrolase [Terriglobia bacterium]
MTARLIDGARIGKEIREEVRLDVEDLKRLSIQPGLAAVLVGDNPASQVYVRNKIKACQSLGIYSREIRLPRETTTEELRGAVQALNQDDAIDGILVQLPLPRQIDEPAILLAVNPEKDVDGLHPMNAGNLALGRKALTPCTPTGVVEILRREKIVLEGSRVVIVGRSNLVGKPQLFLLLQEHATVTICHSRTRQLPQVCREADILVAAMGKPGFVTADFVKPGAVVIDVGINKIAGHSLKDVLAADPSLVAQYEKNHAENKEYVLTGDVNFSSVAAVASAITPVP